jgi:hypothetical protein
VQLLVSHCTFNHMGPIVNYNIYCKAEDQKANYRHHQKHAHPCHILVVSFDTYSGVCSRQKASLLMYNPSQQTSKCGPMNYDILLSSRHQTFKANTIPRSDPKIVRSTILLSTSKLGVHQQKTKANQVLVGSTERA